MVYLVQMLSLYFQNLEIKKCDNFHTLYVTYFCYSFVFIVLKASAGLREVFARFSSFHKNRINSQWFICRLCEITEQIWSGLVSICWECCSGFWLLKYCSIKTVNHSFKMTHFKGICFRSIWKLLRCYSETHYFAAHFFARDICQYSLCFSLSIQMTNDIRCRSSMSYSYWAYTEKRMRTCRIELR